MKELYIGQVGLNHKPLWYGIVLGKVLLEGLQLDQLAGMNRHRMCFHTLIAGGHLGKADHLGIHAVRG